MAAILSQVSSVTDPDHTKLKPILDDGDKDGAAETKDSSKSAKRGAPRLCPQEDEELAELCDFALSLCETQPLCPQEDEELAELCDFALSLCETQHVSSITESDHTKPKLKLDDGDKDEAEETKDTLKSPKQGEAGRGYDDDSSDDDISGPMLSSQEVEELVELCDFALSLYETQHPGEYWKFERGYGGKRWYTLTDQYLLEFFGKKADCNSLRNFVVLAICSDFAGCEKFKVDQCVLVKDDEVEPMDENIKERVSMESGRIFLFSHKELQEHYEKFVEFCKSALTYYQERHVGEAYEFVEIQTARHSIIRGIFIFHAKKKADATLATFKAYTHPLVLRMDIDVVGSFEEYFSGLFASLRSLSLPLCSAVSLRPLPPIVSPAAVLPHRLAATAHHRQRPPSLTSQPLRL
ncbi:uncharacterized protein LOC116002395 isoform X1 [Ipomoea triloba]|uniref:uncharacterized protein LOC116002395 isoform X1 n=1 Tax=Ipomoea triloba TaxID=35885 RepID=UPI00125E7911|nr:uncharacterized protein LOC116002395 isoform X1 [Ipomoea triloba]